MKKRGDVEAEKTIREERLGLMKRRASQLMKYKKPGRKGGSRRLTRREEKGCD